MLSKKIQVNGAKVLVMGLTFKENCPDIRNTKVLDVIKELKQYKMDLDVLDPWCNPEEAAHRHDIEVIHADEVESNTYDAILLTVNHQEFNQLGINNIRSFGKTNHVLYDLKYVFNKGDVDLRL